MYPVWTEDNFQSIHFYKIWVHFEGSYIHLGIKDGPRIRILISSLQSNALIVGDSNTENKNKVINNKSNKKIKLGTNVLHNRCHRSDGAFAKTKAHDLWEDVYVTPGNDSICTSCMPYFRYGLRMII